MLCSRASGSEWPRLSRAGGTIFNTTVDHSLMRGLDPAGPVMRRCGASSVQGPASETIRLIVDARVLLAVTAPPALLSFGQIVVGDDLFS